MLAKLREKFNPDLAIKFVIMLVFVGLVVVYNIWVFNAVGYHIDLNILWPVVMITVFWFAFWLIKNHGGGSALLASLVTFVVVVLVCLITVAAIYWVGWANLRDSLITASAIVLNASIVWLAARGLPGDIEFGKHSRDPDVGLDITHQS